MNATAIFCNGDGENINILPCMLKNHIIMLCVVGRERRLLILLVCFSSLVYIKVFYLTQVKKESIPYMKEWNRVNFDLFDVNVRWNVTCQTDLNRLVVKWSIPEQETSFLIHYHSLLKNTHRFTVLIQMNQIRHLLPFEKTTWIITRYQIHIYIDINIFASICSTYAFAHNRKTYFFLFPLSETKNK